jgi:tetratricopeptide (TPR) repeat protein
MSANNEVFSEAISLHQSKKYDEALAAYLKLLDEGQGASLTREQASTVSQNMAVLYFQQGKTDLAYVFNKKAVTLDPRNSAAQQFARTALENFKVAEIPRELTTTEQLNNLGLRFIPLELIAVLTILFLGLACKTFLDFLVALKKTRIENTQPATLPWTFYTYLGALILWGVILFIKDSDLQRATGIIKSPLVAVQTAAGAQQAHITDVPLGQVVQILQTKDVEGVVYAQIKVPGAFSGWIKKEDLEPLNSAR